MASASEGAGHGGGAGRALPAITSEDFEALSAEWAALHATVPGATPFQHPAFVAAWVGAVDGGEGAVARSPARAFLAIRVEEALVSVAPLALDVGRATLLGDANVSDYGPLLAAPGHEGAVAAGVLEWLMEDLTEALEVWGLAEESPLRAAFADAAEALGWRCEQELEAVAPRLALPASFEEYLAGLAKHERHELRRKRRRLEAAGVARYTSFAEPAEIAGRMDGFLRLMRAREVKDGFLTPAMEALFWRLSRSLSALGMLRLGVLTLDGVELAMVMAFEDADTVYLYNSGYDPQYADLAAGLLSKAYAIEDAIARGKRRFDFLRGSEAYKRHLGGAAAGVWRMRLAAGPSPR